MSKFLTGLGCFIMLVFFSVWFWIMVYFLKGHIPEA